MGALQKIHLTPEQEYKAIRFAMLIEDHVGSKKGIDLMADNPSLYWSCCWDHLCLDAEKLADFIRVIEPPMEMVLRGDWRDMNGSAQLYISAKSQTLAKRTKQVLAQWKA